MIDENFKELDRLARRKKFIAACIQASPVLFDAKATLEKVRSLAADAVGQGAELIVFPEAFVSGYPRGSNFCGGIGIRTPEGREMFRRYHESSIDVPGPAVDILSKIAKENAAHIVIGVIERDGGTLYCTVLTFAASGQYLGKHRKVMPTAAERLVWGFGDGSTLPVFDTEIGRIGSIVCWENYMPMLRAAMYDQRIEIYCTPTADGRPTWLPSMQHIAFEGRCFVLSSNQFCRRKDYPVDYPGILPDDPESIVSRGGNCIVGPLGNVLAGPLWDREGIVTAEIDLGQIAGAQQDFDPIGHYARPDIFSLTVDKRKKDPVNSIVTTPLHTEAGGVGLRDS